MSTDTLTKTTTDYKVKDINLADFGRKEVEIAQFEMPGLMATREKYACGVREHAPVIINAAEPKVLERGTRGPRTLFREKRAEPDDSAEARRIGWVLGRKVCCGGYCPGCNVVIGHVALRAAPYRDLAPV